MDNRYYPTLEEVKGLRTAGNLVPIWREIDADMETPVSAYLKISQGPYSFLLESVEGGERMARYSFIGADPYTVIRSDARDGCDPLLKVAEVMQQYRVVSLPDLPRFHGGAVGYLAYESIKYYEEFAGLPADPLELPESIFMFASTILVFDHLVHKIKVISHISLDGDIEKSYQEAVARIDRLINKLGIPLDTEVGVAGGIETEDEVKSNMSEDQFTRMVEQGQEYIRSGEIIQVVLSQRLTRKTHAEPFTIYRALRGINPSPYMYFLKLDDFHIVGTSPEMLVRVEDGVVSTHPIAGTRRRGNNRALDLALEEELRHDEKECAEHLMLLDLGRNDIGRVSIPGTVEVTQVMEVERYSHVMHLVSHVNGKLRADMTSYDALRACFPAGTVSGAPKIRAMEIISELEPHGRGTYAGALGYISFSGNLDMAITIRTMVIKDGFAYVQAGGGIVADSVPREEYQESMNKARAMVKSIEQAEKMPVTRGERNVTVN